MGRRTYRAPLPDEELWQKVESKAMRRIRKASKCIAPEDRAGWMKFCEQEIEFEKRDRDVLRQSIFKGVK